MSNILMFIGLVAIIAWFPYYIIVRVIKKRDSNLITKFLMWFGVVILLFGVAIAPDTDDSSSKSTKSETSKSIKKDNKTDKKEQTKKKESKKPSSSKSSSSVKKGKKNTDINKINEEMAKSLDEDKGFANGTLDENGQPTQNGTPNDKFAYAKAVESWNLQKSGYIYITVDGPTYFSTSNLALRKQLLDQVKSGAIASYAMGKNDYEGETVLVKVFATGFENEPIAQSKFGSGELKLTKLGMQN